MNLFKAVTGKISRMSYVNRYSSFPVNRRENVAEHSWWVAFISYLIALDLREQGHQVSMGHVLAFALMHDASEVVSGDVIRSYKHRSPEILKAMQDADYEHTLELFGSEEYGETGNGMFDAWRYAKASATLEGTIVSFADMAAVAFYCREEDRSGNRAIRPVLKEAYESWFSRYHDHELLGQYIDQMFPGRRFSEMLREDSLPAQLMFPASGHSEGPVAEHDWVDVREVPLG